MYIGKRKREETKRERERETVLTIISAGCPHRHREFALEGLDLHLLLLPLPSLGLAAGAGHLGEDRVLGRLGGPEPLSTCPGGALPRLLLRAARRGRDNTRRPWARLHVNICLIGHGYLIVDAEWVAANDLLLRLEDDLLLAAGLRQRLQRYHARMMMVLLLQVLSRRHRGYLVMVMMMMEAFVILGLINDRRLYCLAGYFDRHRLNLHLLDVRLDFDLGYHVRGRHINVACRRHVCVSSSLSRSPPTRARRGRCALACSLYACYNSREALSLSRSRYICLFLFCIRVLLYLVCIWLYIYVCACAPRARATSTNMAAAALPSVETSLDCLESSQLAVVRSCLYYLAFQFAQQRQAADVRLAGACIHVIWGVKEPETEREREGDRETCKRRRKSACAPRCLCRL